MRELNAEHGDDDVYGWEAHAFTRNSEVILAQYLLLFITLLCLALVLQFFVGKIWKLHLLTESGSVVLLGMVIGGAIRLGGGDTSNNGEEDFSHLFINVPEKCHCDVCCSYMCRSRRSPSWV